MIRTAIICVGLVILAGCSGAVIAPPAAENAQTPQPTVVLPDASDGDAVPLAVITSLPRGVSATSVTEDSAGCFFYRAADQTVPVLNPDGIAMCRG